MTHEVAPAGAHRHLGFVSIVATFIRLREFFIPHRILLLPTMSV